MGGVSINKVRPEKCWLSAHVVRHEQHFISVCNVKVRLFAIPRSQKDAEEPEELMIEMQRQDGDPLGFIWVFNDMKIFLEERFDMSPQARPEKEIAYQHLRILDAPTSVTELANNLQPLRDAMELSTSPTIQAEALAGLAVAASMDALSAEIVCSALVHSQTDLASLMANSSPAIAYSAAYIAQQVAHSD